MAAIVLAAVIGYVWMSEGGAAAFALAGLWGSYGAARPWSMGRPALAVLLLAATLPPGLLWLAGALRPDFAAAVYNPLAPCLDRVLGFTMADGRAYAVLAAHERLEQWPAIRLGVGSCWMCALPAGGAILLWFRDQSTESNWEREGVTADPMVTLLVGLGLFTLSSMLLMVGAGFGPGGRSLSYGFGALMYPLIFLVWLGSLAALRLWANWWFGVRAIP